MQAIIFDFDGTISDSFKVALEIAHEITHRSQLVMPEEVARLRKLRMIDAARELKIPKWRWPFLLIRGRAQMAKRLGEVQPFQGIHELLAELHKQDFCLFIMSSNMATTIRRFLKKYGLEEYFSKVYGGVGLLGKAQALRRIISQNRLNPDEVIYVGDEGRDIEGAKRAHLPCIAVAWGYNDPQLLAAHTPLSVTTTPEELLDALQKWAGKQ